MRVMDIVVYVTVTIISIIITKIMLNVITINNTTTISVYHIRSHLERKKFKKTEFEPFFKSQPTLVINALLVLLLPTHFFLLWYY